jgi:hypothetical protein
MLSANLSMMALYEATISSRFIGGAGREGGGTGGWNAPRRRVEDSGTSSHTPFPKQVRSICHKVVHTIRIV